jgi:ABC-type transport system involved in multi-copper enzyme maturation permease subunit
MDGEALKATPARPTLLAAAMRVFDLSLGDMLWSRRTVFMALVVGGPVLIALIYRVLLMVVSGDELRVGGLGRQASGVEIFGALVWIFYVRFSVPVLALFYGTALIADEVEDRTITYLFTRPVRRGAVLLGKYLAYLTCTVFVVLPSIMIVFFLVAGGPAGIAAGFPSLVADLGILAVGLAVYGALFAWVGALVKRPLVTGLVFLFGWEPAVLVIPGYLKKFTVQHYLQALVPHSMPSDGLGAVIQGLFRDVPALPVALFSLIAGGVLFLWLAIVVTERREYVLDQ